ncbi:hypothetical protein G7Y89_g7585 [Cudoniella acicularis]|uniref:2EXR domain-containing protein n=1 Tax=Cudoniella acicularis TaxID=354080 RepID=A0A8H4W1E6_9HELO|nr:hypothetical protein G7Y89_g7585 [Cudoniella acicularis]
MWQCTLPEARILDISLTNVNFPETEFNATTKAGRWLWKTETPEVLMPLLLTCRDARFVVLRSYERSNIWVASASRKVWTRILVNYARDTFYFSETALTDIQKILRGRRLLPGIAAIEVDKIQKLGLPTSGGQCDS